MKRLIKAFAAETVYRMYRIGVLKSHIRVSTIDESLDRLLYSEDSLVRFGDGEIVMMKGRSLKLQQASDELSQGLKEILGYEYDGLMVSVQGIFDGLEMYHKRSRLFWKEHLLFCRRLYEVCCNKNRIYCDTAVTRCYYAFENKGKCAGWFEKFRKVWDNKEIVVVEGVRTHNGVGNDLFERVKSVERILCPPSDAYGKYDRIRSVCMEYPKDRLFLLSVGVTAKFLARDLFLAGYRVIDIGNLDMEYEWFLQEAVDKVPVPKHEVTGKDENIRAGYTEYLKQVKAVIE